MNRGSKAWSLGLALLVAGAAARAGVDRSIADEYVRMWKGKTAIAKVDVKVIRIRKQVRGDQMRGFAGVETLEQTKDATEITPEGPRYRSEAQSREFAYAPRGTAVTIEAVDFGKSSVELEVRRQGADESTIVTFAFDHKLDGGFADRASFDRMLSETFALVP